MFIHKLLIKVAVGRDQKEEWKESFTKTYKEKFKAFQLRKKLYIQLSLDIDVHNRQQLETTHTFLQSFLFVVNFYQHFGR